jgi:hypothetical protein
VKAMSLNQIVATYKRKMNPKVFKEFLSYVHTSVDLNAKNTNSGANKNLAKLQIRQLAEKVIGWNEVDNQVDEDEEVELRVNANSVLRAIQKVSAGKKKKS